MVAPPTKVVGEGGSAGLATETSRWRPSATCPRLGEGRIERQRRETSGTARQREAIGVGAKTRTMKASW